MKNSFKTFLYSILCSLCIGVSIFSYGQEKETSDESRLTPKFGIKGGINLANLYVDDVKDQNMKVGVVAGFYAKLPVTTGISIQPELLYSSKGAQATYDNVFQGQGTYRFNLNYLEAPVTLVFNIVKKLNVNAGGYAAYLTSANVKNVKDGNITGVTDLNSDNFNRFDYGLVGGIALDIENITIGARYNYGLREVGIPGSLAGELTKNSKNSALSFYIGIAF